MASALHFLGVRKEERALIRITQSDNGHEKRLLVEGTLSDGWADSLEECWVRAKAESRRRPLRLDLSSVTYVDDKGRELLKRMMRDGVEIYTTGILTREVIGEITTDLDRDDAQKLIATSEAA